MIGYALTVYLRDPIQGQHDYTSIVVGEGNAQDVLYVDSMKVDRDEIACRKKGTPSLVIPMINVAGYHRVNEKPGDSSDNVIDL